MNLKKIFFLIIFLILLSITLFIIFKKPSLDKNWTEDARLLPDIALSTTTVEVKHIRDWRYNKGSVISKDFYTESFEVDQVTKAYFLLNPFGKWEGVGHTFFLFELRDGKSVSVSVEARRAEGVEYGAIKGLFNSYELWYTWGSAADLFSRRAIYHNEDLYLYPLLISEETAQGLFIDLAKTTELLETKAQFYNTVLSNCTNVLADSANRVNKKSIPWTFARIFTGYADNKLYDLKLIPHDQDFDLIYQNARIDSHIKNLFENKEEYSKEDFWKELKKKIEGGIL